MFRHGAKLDEQLLKLDKKRSKDALGGGRYIVSGFGTMGRNVSPAVHPPAQPALRKSLTFAENDDVAKIVGRIFPHVSECIDKHCGNVYQNNQTLIINKELAWPPFEYQSKEMTIDQRKEWTWMSSQFIVRRWGPGLYSDWPLDYEIVAAHTDPGDLDCDMFHCYRTGGGKSGRGGTVAGTDLVIFENAEGGPGFRVKTCVEDTVVIVVLNSKRQLHGCVKSSDDFVQDDLAWTTRIIPYLPQGVYNWMIRHPQDAPFIKIP
jgi:hypothetical protein